MAIGALVAATLIPLTVGQASAGTPAPSADPSASESVNLALLPGAVASAKSQRMTPPAATYAPANAVDVFVHNGWSSNYASVGNGYDPTQDWFQVKLATPAPVYEVFSRWTSPAKPTEYDLQVSTDADCQTWSTVTHVVNPSDKDSQVIDRKDPISCVRMQALATTSTTGYTINEFEISSRTQATAGRGTDHSRAGEADARHRSAVGAHGHLPDRDLQQRPCRHS